MMRSSDRARLAPRVAALLLPLLLSSCSPSEEGSDGGTALPPGDASRAASRPPAGAQALADAQRGAPAAQHEEGEDGEQEGFGPDEGDAEDEKGQTFETVLEKNEVAVREVSLGKVGDGYFEKSARVSADGRHVCWANLLGEESGVFLDGRRVGAPFQGLGATGLVISPDGSRVAYSVNRGTQVAVRVDDKELAGEYDGVSKAGLVFSPDSKRFAFVAGRGGKQIASIDGQEGPAWDGVRGEGVRFSQDGRRVAYIATQGEDWFVVIDGMQSGPWKAVGDQGVQFSADGEHVAFGAQRPAEGGGGEWVVVVDGKEGPAYASVGQLVFAPVGARFAYNAEIAKSRWVVVADGKPSAEAQALSSRPTFSPDGKHLAYSLARDDKLFVVVDGVEGPGYDRMSKKGKRAITFSEDGSSHAYVGKRGDERVIVVDGQEVSTTASLFQRTLRFLPGSKDLAYLANHGKQSTMLVCRGQESKAYQRIVQDSDVIGPRGERTAFAVRDGRQVFFVVDGVEGDRYAYIYPDLFGFVPGGDDFVYVGRRGPDSFPVLHGWGKGPAYEEIPSGSRLLLDEDGTARFVARRKGEFVLVEIPPRAGR